MKKRISALVLALLMMVSLFGCAPKEELYAGGSVSARTYENALLGLQCFPPADWLYLTEEELRIRERVIEKLYAAVLEREGI